jgi:hypothetical protein
MNDREAPILINRQVLNAQTDLVSFQLPGGSQTTSIITYNKGVKTKLSKWVIDRNREYFLAGLPILYLREDYPGDEGTYQPHMRVLCQPDGREDFVNLVATELTDDEASLTKVTSFELVANLCEPGHGKYVYLQHPEPAFVQWYADPHTFFSNLPLEVRTTILGVLALMLSTSGDSLAVAYCLGVEVETSLMCVTDFLVDHWMRFDMETEYFRDEQGPILLIHRLRSKAHDELGTN